MAKRKSPRFWIGFSSGRIYMTHAYREDARHPGTMICTGERYDVTDSVLEIARQLDAALAVLYGEKAAGGE
jgi:hypothetical protein